MFACTNNIQTMPQPASG